MMKKEIANYLTQNRDQSVVRNTGRLLDTLGLKSSVAKLLFPTPPTASIINEKNNCDPKDLVLARLEEISKNQEPIVIGPWLSEVGFELLYWIPFMRWWVKTYNIDRRRITVISRGNVKSWYGGIHGRYIDIFDIFSPEEFRELNEKRWVENGGLQKHLTISSFDRLVLEKAGFSLKPNLAHPELMYLLFDGYWNGSAGSKIYSDHVSFKQFDAPKHPILDSLPKEYLAVKFYSRPSFVADETTKHFVDRFTRQLADKTPVVFMNTHVAADDHGEFELPDHPNVFSIHDKLNPSDNLAAQSAIVAGSMQTYCTYGGFAYLPLLFGVPTVSLYTVDKHFMKIHGSAAYQLSFRTKTPLSVAHISAFNA